MIRFRFSFRFWDLRVPAPARDGPAEQRAPVLESFFAALFWLLLMMPRTCLLLLTQLCHRGVWNKITSHGGRRVSLPAGDVGPATEATAPSGGADHRCLTRHGGEWWLDVCRRREKAQVAKELGRSCRAVRSGRLSAGGWRVGRHSKRATMQRLALVAAAFGCWRQ